MASSSTPIAVVDPILRAPLVMDSMADYFSCKYNTKHHTQVKKWIINLVPGKTHQYFLLKSIGTMWTSAKQNEEHEQLGLP